MNKLKKALADLRAYLGKDQHGLNLLAEVEAVANEVRKQAAAEKERAEQATTVKAAAVSTVHQTQLENVRLKTELQQLQSQQAQSARDALDWQQKAEELQQQLDKLLGPEEPPVVSDELLDMGALVSAVQLLRRWKRVGPKSEYGAALVADNADRTKCRPVMFYLEDLMTRLTPDQCESLGRFVAVLALLGMPCTIEARKNWGKFIGSSTWDEQNMTCLPNFVYWFRVNVEDALSRWNGASGQRTSAAYAAYSMDNDYQ